MRWLSQTFPLYGDGPLRTQNSEDTFAQTSSIVEQATTLASRNKLIEQRPDYPSHRFIDLAKSATGSSFFSYCWESELAIRKKTGPFAWGDGPDLVIIETGINDVVLPTDFFAKSTSQSYSTDFESLLLQIKGLPSRPAVVVLDAASKLLSGIQNFHDSAEFATHLVPSVWLDVPVISAKAALSTPVAEKDAEQMGEIFLIE